jgi:hypothetical protein
VANAQERVYELLERSAPEGEEPFSHFDLEHAGEAAELAGELSTIAARDGVDAAIARANEVADKGRLGVAKYAMKLFVTHDTTSAAELTIPTPEFTDSEPLPSAGTEEEAT